MFFYKQREIISYKDGTAKCIKDIVVEELPLTLFVEGEKYALLFCSPGDLEYLITGFLLSEGLIEIFEDINSLSIDSDEGVARIGIRDKSADCQRRLEARTTSGYSRALAVQGKEAITSKKSPLTGNDMRIGGGTVISLMEEFGERGAVFKNTGGVHSCALVYSEKIEIFHEDIGRHNAMDKVIGHGLKMGLEFERCAILSSGRISSEMLIKAAGRRIPVILSKAAPTVLAIELAQAMNITLVGFVRGKRFNVYSAFHRVKNTV